MKRQVAARCRIEPGGSSEERPEEVVVRLALAEGGEYAAPVDRQYCHRTDGAALADRELPLEGTEGLVEAWLVGVDGESATIYLPTGDTVRVDRGRLVRVRG